MASEKDGRLSTANIVRVILTVVAVLLVVYAAFLVRAILVLVVVAGFLAAGLDPAVRRLEKLGLKRGQAVAVIFIGAIAVITAFFVAVIPPLVTQVTEFATNVPQYVENLAEENPEVQEFVSKNDISEKLRQATQNVPAAISGSVGNILGIAGSVIGTFFSIITVVVLTIYFLLSFARIREGSLKLVPKSKRENIRDLLDPILDKIGGYIAGQATVALLAGALAFVFLSIVGVPFPVALALWVTIAALIPLVGATLGAVPAVIAAFFVSTGVGIGTLVYFLAYQQIENYVIAPRIMTRAVDVSPAAVLLAALIGGSLLGFIGALMAIPAAASLKLIANEVFIPKAEAA